MTGLEYSVRCSIRNSLVPQELRSVVHSVLDLRYLPDSLDLDFRYSDLALQIHFENFVRTGSLDFPRLDSLLLQTLAALIISQQFLY